MGFSSNGCLALGIETVPAKPNRIGSEKAGHYRFSYGRGNSLQLRHARTRLLALPLDCCLLGFYARWPFCNDFPPPGCTRCACQLFCGTVPTRTRIVFHCQRTTAMQATQQDDFPIGACRLSHAGSAPGLVLCCDGARVGQALKCSQ